MHQGHRSLRAGGLRHRERQAQRVHGLHADVDQGHHPQQPAGQGQEGQGEGEEGAEEDDRG